MTVASVTRIRLRSIRFLPAFLGHVLMTVLQVRRADGCMAFTASRRGQAFWTLTLWRDEAALKAFMLSGAHRKAMPHLVHWCDEASTARFDWATPDLPTWDEARRRMAATGRTTPLRHTSPAHAAGSALGEDGAKTTLNAAIALDS